MNSSSCIFASAMVAGLVALHATGQNISITQSGADLFNITEQALVNGKWQISITASGSPAAQLTVRSTSGSNPIRYIKVNPVWTTSASLNEIVVLSVLENANTSIPEIGEIVREDIDSQHIAELWVGLVQTSGSLGVQGDTSKKIIADIVSGIDVAGPIYGPIQSGPRYFDSSATSTINFIRTSQGGVFGDVSALYGSINEITSGADIGSSATTVNIYAKSSIKSVIADAIWANIDSTRNGGSENIWYVKTRTGAHDGSVKAYRIESPNSASVSGLSVAGDLVANVTTLSHLREPIVVGGSVPVSTTIDIGGQVLTREAITGDNGSIIVAGDFAGTLLVGDKLYGNVNVSGSLASSGVIRIANDVFTGTSSGHTYSGSMTIGGSCAGLVRIGGSLSGPITCTTNSGLTGQVIINAANGSGTWSDKVTVGSVELSSTSHGAPYYDVASSSLGGGAIGLVPYHLYGVDCIPAKADSPAPVILDSAFNQKLIGGYAQYNTSIKLRFYGPVFQNDTDPAIKVEQLLGSEWIDLTDRAVVTFGSATGGNPREVTIRGNDGSNSMIPFLSGTYRITRVAGELKCQGTSANPAPDVAAFTYAFTLTDDCNKNNRLDSVDLAEVAGDPPVHVYDFNSNGIVDSCDRPTGGWCLADIDMNGFVNGDDYDWFSLFFEESHFLADVNEDGFVNGDDYDLFSELYETACQ